MIKLTKENFETEIKSGHTIVDFYADWCMPCKAMMPSFEASEPQYVGKVKFCKANIDEIEEIASELNIMSVPTVKIYKDGEVVDSKVGAMSIGQIKAFLDKNLG